MLPKEVKTVRSCLSQLKAIGRTSLIAGALFLVGCGRIGPTNLPDDHLAYNKSVNVSLNQQLLLNIVRSHYNEPALYVSIDNITSRDTYQANGELSLFNPFRASGATPQNPALTSKLGGTIKQEPSYIYAPETNDKYAVELLQPLRIKALYLVIESESEIGDILRLMLRRLGPYINFPAQPLEAPYGPNLTSVKNFIALTRAITRIYAENGYLISVQTIPVGHGSHRVHENLIIPMPRHPNLTAQQWHLLNTLGIQRHDKAIILSDTGSNPAKDTIHIQVRSLMNVTDFLAFGVAKTGMPEQTVTNKPTVYHEYQRLLTKHLINVKVSNTYPKSAFVAVKTHQHWYYIDDRDIGSKTTFRLYRVFNDLTQADSKSNNILISS